MMALPLGPRPKVEFDEMPGSREEIETTRTWLDLARQKNPSTVITLFNLCSTFFSTCHHKNSAQLRLRCGVT